MKRSRRRSSGTRQALAIHESIYELSSVSPVDSSATGSASTAASSLVGRLGGGRGPCAGRGLLVTALLRLVRGLEPGDASAGRFDLLDRALREGVCRDRQLHVEVAVAEDFHVAVEVADEAGLLQQLGRDVGARVEPSEVADVQRPDARPERADRHRVLRGRAALLAHAHVGRHLAALEAGAHGVRARPRLLALDPAAGVAALARAHAAADALARLARLRGLEIGEIQVAGHRYRSTFTR